MDSSKNVRLLEFWNNFARSPIEEDKERNFGGNGENQATCSYDQKDQPACFV